MTPQERNERDDQECKQRYEAASPEERAEFDAWVQGLSISMGKPYLSFVGWRQRQARCKVLRGMGLTEDEAKTIGGLSNETRARLLLDGRSIP